MSNVFPLLFPLFTLWHLITFCAILSAPIIFFPSILIDWRWWKRNRHQRPLTMLCPKGFLSVFNFRTLANGCKEGKERRMNSEWSVLGWLEWKVCFSLQSSSIQGIRVTLLLWLMNKIKREQPTAAPLTIAFSHLVLYKMEIGRETVWIWIHCIYGNGWKLIW